MCHGSARGFRSCRKRLHVVRNISSADSVRDNVPVGSRIEGLPSKSREKALDDVLSGRLPRGIRPEIAQSWRRSVRSGLRPDRFAVPEIRGDERSRLVDAAEPLLAELSDELDSTEVSVVLSDKDGSVLARSDSGHEIRKTLDRIELAPGYTYAERFFGTNAVGTSLAQGKESVVFGNEHYAEKLTEMACAAVPLRDPLTRRLVGVIDLSSKTKDASPMMLPYAKRVARQITERLAAGASPYLRQVRTLFQAEKVKNEHPSLFVHGNLVMLSAEIEGRLGSADVEALRRRAQAHGCPLHKRVTEPVRLPSGLEVRATFDPVSDGDLPVGIIVSLASRGTDAADADYLEAIAGWETLTPAERRVARLAAGDLTIKEIADEIYVSPFTVDSHLRAIYRKLDIHSRVSLARIIGSATTGEPHPEFLEPTD